MHRAFAERALLTLVSLVSFALTGTSAYAQAPESIGIRAQGMGGAFTAVADDATAVWWNPAGLAGGSYFSTVLEYGHPKDPPDTNANVKGVSIAFPALGLGYYRLPISQMRPPTSTGQATANRQDQGTLSELGVTVGLPARQVAVADAELDRGQVRPQPSDDRAETTVEVSG